MAPITESEQKDEQKEPRKGSDGLGESKQGPQATSAAPEGRILVTTRRKHKRQQQRRAASVRCRRQKTAPGPGRDRADLVHRRRLPPTEKLVDSGEIEITDGGSDRRWIEARRIGRVASPRRHGQSPQRRPQASSRHPRDRRGHRGRTHPSRSAARLIQHSARSASPPLRRRRDQTSVGAARAV